MAGLDWLRGREYNRPLGDAVDGATNGQFLRDVDDAVRWAPGLYQQTLADAPTIQDGLQITGYLFASDELEALIASLDTED